VDWSLRRAMLFNSAPPAFFNISPSSPLYESVRTGI
jgi:hypothetical protein